VGKVAYIGATQFSSGKWIGLVLDEPKVSRIKKNESAFRGVNIRVQRLCFFKKNYRCSRGTFIGVKGT
jgi:dynactin complex subunit